MTQQEKATNQFALASLDDERSIRPIVDLLFIYTDQKAWAKARQLFVDGQIEVEQHHRARYCGSCAEKL